MGSTLELDFGDALEVDIATLDLRAIDTILVGIPFSYVGSSNSHVDVCVDYLHASWAVERLGGCVKSVVATMSSGGVTAVLTGLRPTLLEALADCAVLFAEDDPIGEDADRRDDVMNAIADFEDGIHAIAPRAPDIVDGYLVNLVAGANHEWRSESPAYYHDQMTRFPERQLEYFRSAHSTSLGAACYASRGGWLLPVAVDIDQFFRETGQKYAMSDFLTAEVVVVDGQPLAIAEDVVIDFPMVGLLESQTCAGLVSVDPDDVHDGPYDWLRSPFVIMPGRSGARQQRWGAGPACQVHPSGDLAVVDDGSYRHLLYTGRSTSRSAVEQAQESAAALADRLSLISGGARPLELDWASLSDETFERLCYDLIAAHPRYDADTIRKLGKSRSRDGGRDIQVHDIPARSWDEPRKWIFQCKLVTNGSSLGATKVADVGDMLDQYSAQGFGVMTSAPIDATLYDKLDAVCDRRGVGRHHWSVLELERALARNHQLRRRYFPTR